MSRIEMANSVDGKMITVWISDQLIEGSMTVAVELAKKDIAKMIWEENKTQIMAKMDLTGLANLIAIHASDALKEKK